MSCDYLMMLAQYCVTNHVTLHCRTFYVNTLSDHGGPIRCIAVSATLGDIATVSVNKIQHPGTAKETSSERGREEGGSGREWEGEGDREEREK